MYTGVYGLYITQTYLLTRQAWPRCLTIACIHKPVHSSIHIIQTCRNINVMANCHGLADLVVTYDICTDIAFETTLHSRYLTYIHGALNSKNSRIFMCSRLALLGSGSSISKSISYTSFKYGYDRDRLCEVTPLISNSTPKSEDIHTAVSINELLNFRHERSQTREEIQDLLDYFCLK